MFLTEPTTFKYKSAHCLEYVLGGGPTQPDAWQEAALRSRKTTVDPEGTDSAVGSGAPWFPGGATLPKHWGCVAGAQRVRVETASPA